MLITEVGSNEKMCNLKEHENQQNHMWFCINDEKTYTRDLSRGQWQKAMKAKGGHGHIDFFATK